MKAIHIAAIGAVLLAGCTSQLEKEFIAGCNQTGGAAGYCSCVYKKMEPQLKAAEKNPNLMMSEDFKSSFQRSTAACVKQ